MRNSIQHFIDFRITNLQKSAKKFSQSPQDIAGFVNAVKEEALQFALDFIGETFTTCNDVLRESPVRRATWEVVRTDEKTLITSIGSVRYEKTLFKNKKSGERRYLVDAAMGIDSHERISEDAVAQMLEESAQTCYRKGGEAVSILDKVSKETVKDKLHALEFPAEDEADPVAEKKVVDYLFIEADEDHAFLQFNEKKGDLKKSESGRKLNGIITKLVYVHEGIEKDAPQSTRHHLVNPHYFSGLYEGKEGNNELWDEVWNYLDRTYDLSKVKKVYLSADGGAWIMAGRKRLHGLVYALDEFHMQKYLIKMTNHMLDSAEDARKVLCQSIKEDTKEEFLSYVDMLGGHARTDSEKAKIAEGAKYVLDNWSAAKVRLTNRRSLCGCSAEGHVSHVLSSRMSTGPMGWSKTGADKMARLRAWYWNGGDMLELARYQKQALPKAAGDEDVVLSAAQMYRDETNGNPKWAKYAEKMQVEVSPQIKKMLSIGMHDFIWMLR